MSGTSGTTTMTRVELDLTLDDSSADDAVHVHGVVRTPDGTEQPFVGWVGLLALLQTAVSQPQR